MLPRHFRCPGRERPCAPAWLAIEDTGFRSHRLRTRAGAITGRHVPCATPTNRPEHHHDARGHPRLATIDWLFRRFQYLTVPLSVLPEAAHRAAQATADMVIKAARSAPGSRPGGTPVPHIPAAVTASGYCQM